MSVANKRKQVLAIREGGQTLRCHTIPHTSLYNVAVHSYNAVSLVLLLYPGTPSVNLIKAVMWHDVPERWTGDIPAPAKWASAELKAVLDNLEIQILNKLGLGNLFDLTEEEEHWLGAVDLLELLIWAHEQAHVGNRAVIKLLQRVESLFFSRLAITPEPVRLFIKDFQWSRSLECHEILRGGIYE